MTEHDKLAEAQAWRVEVARRFLRAEHGGMRLHWIPEHLEAVAADLAEQFEAALSAARAQGAAEAFEQAAKVCDERAVRWRLRAERCARSGDTASLVHSDRMDEAESCAIDIRDQALAREAAK